MIQATPDNYVRLLRSLQAGDTLQLAPGVYTDGLPVHRLLGEPSRPIVIQGPARGSPAVFHANPERNTVSIVDAAHVVIRDITVDGLGLPVDGVKAEGHARYSHHITLERMVIRNHDHDQQTVGISTKCPSWNWTIRENVVERVGTGMYLGNSDGSGAFSSGLIEDNIVRQTIGYNLQIKHQLLRTTDIASAETERFTIIRRNRFEKGNDSSRAEMARPNVLLGHFPTSGPGSNDRYLVYANVFAGNPTEALFQAEGNVALYNNLFMNRDGAAIIIRPHNHLPRWVAVFHNTVIAATTGISVMGGEAGFQQRVLANAVFAGEPIRGTTSGLDFVAPLSDAARYLVIPRTPHEKPGAAPKKNRLLGAGPLPEELSRLSGADLDLAGRTRALPIYGACAVPEVACP